MYYYRTKNEWLIALIITIPILLLIVMSIIPLRRDGTDQNASRTSSDAVESTFEGEVGVSTAPIKIGASELQQQMIELAWELNPDIDMIYTFEAESGWQFDAWGNLGERGICQLMPWVHKEFINNHIDNEDAQVRYCVDVWLKAKKEGRMPFAGYCVRDKAINNFEWR